MLWHVEYRGLTPTVQPTGDAGVTKQLIPTLNPRTPTGGPAPVHRSIPDWRHRLRRSWKSERKNILWTAAQFAF